MIGFIGLICCLRLFGWVGVVFLGLALMFCVAIWFGFGFGFGWWLLVASC